MNFKEQLKISQATHLEKQKEVISDFYVACKLWPNSNPKTQRVLLSKALNNGLTLNVGHVRVLIDIFPDTPMSRWVNVEHKK